MVLMALWLYGFMVRCDVCAMRAKYLDIEISLNDRDIDMNKLHRHANTGVEYHLIYYKTTKETKKLNQCPRGLAGSTFNRRSLPSSQLPLCDSALANTHTTRNVSLRNNAR